jgi:hypothetical protein
MMKLMANFKIGTRTFTGFGVILMLLAVLADCLWRGRCRSSGKGDVRRSVSVGQELTTGDVHNTV